MCQAWMDEKHMEGGIKDNKKNIRKKKELVAWTGSYCHCQRVLVEVCHIIIEVWL